MGATRRFKECKTNPGHIGVMPVGELRMELLPQSLQTTECLESIQSMIERTVRVTVGCTSISRPETFPDSITPYPYSAFRHAHGRHSRISTGFLEDDIFKTNEGKECPCHECLISGNPATHFYEFVVCTATHVIFDESEAKNAVFELFYDSNDRKDVKFLYGTTILGDLSQSERIYTDSCKVLCVTHDQILSDKLIKILKKPADMAMDSKAIIVFHPHGAYKHIIFGNFLGIRLKFFKKEENNVRFAPGMESAATQELKQALLHTDTSGEEDTKSDCAAIVSSNLEPESFICDADISLPRMFSLENGDGSETKWCQFPLGTKFVTRDMKVLDVPEGMEFDINKLYSYVTYDAPTCPGSSGARVKYKRERFVHCGHIALHQGQFVKRSGFIKAVDCSLFGHDDDTMSIGGSSLTDEGYSDYIPDVEDVFKDDEFEDDYELKSDPSQEASLSLTIAGLRFKREEPLKMLNESVVNFLQNMEACYAEVASHETVYYHIQSYAEEEFAMFPDKYKFRSRLELEQALNKLVFNQLFSAVVANAIPEEILLSQEASYWAVRHLEDTEPTDQGGRYLFNPGLRDSWFDQEIDLPAQCRGESGDGNRGRRKIYIYNKLDQAVDETAIETQSNFSYHYHGTNVLNAQSILLLGIVLRKGKPKRDYSDGHGFYVSRDFYQASSWARRGHGFPVVFVFKTPNDFFSDKTSHIHLRATDLNTMAILKYFRSGCVQEREAVDRIREPSIDECDSISGPILFDLGGFYDGNSLVLKSHQTCIRRQNCANAFYRHIDGIIFNP